MYTQMKGLASSGSWSRRSEEDIQEEVAACNLHQLSQQPIATHKGMHHKWQCCNNKAIAMSMYLSIAYCFKWFESEAPYFIQHTPKAPHITGSGVLLVTDGFWSCPLYRDHSSMREIVVFFIQVTRQTKVSNLQYKTISIKKHAITIVQDIEQTLHTQAFVTSTFLAARSRWTNDLLERYCMPKATCWE